MITKKKYNRKHKQYKGGGMFGNFFQKTMKKSSKNKLKALGVGNKNALKSFKQGLQDSKRNLKQQYKQSFKGLKTQLKGISFKDAKKLNPTLTKFQFRQAQIQKKLALKQAQKQGLREFKKSQVQQLTAKRDALTKEYKQKKNMYKNQYKNLKENRKNLNKFRGQNMASKSKQKFTDYAMGDGAKKFKVKTERKRNFLMRKITGRDTYKVRASKVRSKVRKKLMKELEQRAKKGDKNALAQLKGIATRDIAFGKKKRFFSGANKQQRKAIEAYRRASRKALRKNISSATKGMTKAQKRLYIDGMKAKREAQLQVIRTAAKNRKAYTKIRQLDKLEKLSKAAKAGDIKAKLELEKLGGFDANQMKQLAKLKSTKFKSAVNMMDISKNKFSQANVVRQTADLRKSLKKRTGRFTPSYFKYRNKMDRTLNKKLKELEQKIGKGEASPAELANYRKQLIDTKNLSENYREQAKQMSKLRAKTRFSRLGNRLGISNRNKANRKALEELRQTKQEALQRLKTGNLNKVDTISKDLFKQRTNINKKLDAIKESKRVSSEIRKQKGWLARKRSKTGLHRKLLEEQSQERRKLLGQDIKGPGLEKSLKDMSERQSDARGRLNIYKKIRQERKQYGRFSQGRSKAMRDRFRAEKLKLKNAKTVEDAKKSYNETLKDIDMYKKAKANRKLIQQDKKTLLEELKTQKIELANKRATMSPEEYKKQMAELEGQMTKTRNVIKATSTGRMGLRTSRYRKDLRNELKARNKYKSLNHYAKTPKERAKEIRELIARNKIMNEKSSQSLKDSIKTLNKYKGKLKGLQFNKEALLKSGKSPKEIAEEMKKIDNDIKHYSNLTNSYKGFVKSGKTHKKFFGNHAEQLQSDMKNRFSSKLLGQFDGQ